VVEPVSAAAAGAYVVKKMSAGLGRVLGPAADEVAEALRRFTARRLENVGRVVENADAKATGDGVVPERVAFRVLDEGSYSDDQLVVEYLGGVLASSRTPLGRDDRGNTWTALVARLSTYHLRTHYIMYSAAQRLLHGRKINLQDASEAQSQARVWMPFDVYIAAMEFNEAEDGAAMMANSLWALSREGLIGSMASGSVEKLKENSHPWIPADGIVYGLTVPGIELFMWAAGRGQGYVTRDFLGVDPFVIDGIDVPDGARLVHELPNPAGAEVEHID
jgi:hypothetical protein